MEFFIGVPVANHSRISIAFMVTAASLTISACASGSAENSLLAAAGSAAAACPLLAGMIIASAKIGLPTTGGVIDSAALVVANATGNTNGEYCLVKGSIHPSSQGASDIKFQANLPTSWNHRSVHMGGGGYNGTVSTGLGGITFAPMAQTPLARGYATFGSDSGHQSALAVPSSDASFALNDEALQNFGYAHIKKTHDTVMEILKAYFGTNVSFKSYFAGGSTGGREALTAVQRFPTDYDGAFVGSPTAIFRGIRMAGFPIGQAAYAAPSGYLNPVKQALVYQRSLAACDSLDGLIDGVISNIPACQAIATSTLASLRCPSGNDEGDSCLSDAQLNVINALHNGLTLPYAMAFNSTRYAGYNALEGTDFSVNNFTLGLGNSPVLLEPPTNQTNGYLFSQGVQWLRYFVVKDPTFNPLGFNPLYPGQYMQRVVDLSSIVGAENSDLSTFKAHGGKLIMLQGLADSAVSPNGTIDYFGKVVGLLGKDNVDDFMRFYTVPGMGHGIGAFVPSWDPLSALDAWVSGGATPDVLVGTDTNTATAGRSRPLCRYPAWPKYKGSGDVNSASNFVCSTS